MIRYTAITVANSLFSIKKAVLLPSAQENGFRIFSARQALPHGEEAQSFRLALHAFTVFTRSWATVMGPMPPGTGVMAEASGATAS